MPSNLLHSKLCLFVFGATFAASNWQFNSICSEFKLPIRPVFSNWVNFIQKI